MATRFWVGGTGNWDASTTTNWAATSGGAGGASVPTSADTVTFDTLSNATAYTVTVTATANCSDLTIGNPLVGAITFAGSSALNIYGSLSLASGVSATYTGTIVFRATSTGKTISMNGNTSLSLGNGGGFNGVGGGWTFLDTFTSTVNETVLLVAGTLDMNGQIVNIPAFSSTGSLTRVLTMGAATVTLSTTNRVAWEFTGSNYSLTANTASITTTTSSTAPFTGGGLTYYNVTINKSSQTTNTEFQGSANTFNNLTVSSGASKTVTCTLYANQTISGTLTITGNSVINRLLVKSNTLGTARTITAAAISVDKVDFQDITGAGAASWDMSAAAGYTGDCGGNTMKALGTAAFTTAATCNWSSGATWSTATWSNHSVPLPQDTATFTTAGTVTITQDMPRIGSVDFTGSANKTWTDSVGFEIYGSVTLISGMTLSGTSNATFSGRGSNTVTTAGKTWIRNFTLNAPGGTLTLSDAFTCNNQLTFAAGTFNANNFNVTLGTCATSGSSTKVVTMGSGTWICNAAGGGWTFASTGLTLNANTSTIKMMSNSSASSTFAGGGLTYYNFWNATTNTGVCIITGSNTFNQFKVDAGRTQQFTAGTTTTIADPVFTGTSGAGEITIGSVTAASHTLTKSGGGTVTADYCDISYSTATPTLTWLATNSTNGGNNSGWYFDSFPAPATSNFFMFF